MRNEKVKQAKKIIPGLTVTAQKKDLHRNKYGLAWQYYFSIATNKGRYAAIFTDSINNHNNNIPVNLDDILYSWIVDADCFEFSQDFDDFCLQYGYDFKKYNEYDTRYKAGKHQAIEAWKGCEHAYRKIVTLLTDKQAEKLHDLFQDY